MAQNLSIEQLAHDNYLIRISPEATDHYLLLPIEESAPESQVKFVVDNTLVRQLNIRLALTTIDYFVPLELDAYQGRLVTLHTHLAGDRSRQDATLAVCLDHIALTDHFDVTNREPYRPVFHHTPTYGWMNDPNGMFYLDGEWHLYYQYNPYGSMWGNMHWGHSVSRDLVNWEHRGTALFPDVNGTIFSGSCIVDKANTAGFGNDAVIAMYTSCLSTPWGDLQEQSIAYSLDHGNTFHVYEGNPVLTADINDFRDPNMFWNDDISAWNLILAAGQEMRIYSSPDMKHWTEESRFGNGLGCHDGVWECPDLIPLTIENGRLKGQKRWVLICNTNPGGPAGGSATQYFIGDFDGHRFTVDDATRYQDAALWQDYGKDHYAAVSFSNAPDGRHPMMAWMSNWQYANGVPTRQYRSANTICREPFLYEAADRQLYLGSRPSPEYDALHLDRTVKVKGTCTVTLSNDEGEALTIRYDQKAMTLTVDRSKSGATRFSRDFAVPATAPVHNRLTTLRIFIDNSSVEVFGNNGEVSLTTLVFPQHPYTHLTLNNKPPSAE